jgi:hypothetical protein
LSVDGLKAVMQSSFSDASFAPHTDDQADKMLRDA